MNINGINVKEYRDIIIPYIKSDFEDNVLEKQYQFNIEEGKYNDTSIFSKAEQDILNNNNSPLKKNIALKEIISNKLIHSKNPINIYSWIVKQWGGITKFNKTEMEINYFFNELESKNVTAKYFGTISSLSKIASFKYLNKYFIYDSRVAYALNWLIIKSKNNIKKFPMPSGRNTDLSDNYNIKTILALLKSNIYLSNKYAYIIYCELINEIYNKLKDICKEPYYIEMYLFSLFEKIIEEIKMKVELTINI
ncbi:hypothetical protein LQZ19_07340 [Treponema primitia]|uniref:hypothetical protein n=1 Tax=Treponema primitia TaxID=88058 RepID=UPI00398048F7